MPWKEWPLSEYKISYLIDTLGQFTRNYTQTVKRAADNKERLGIKHRESARYSACFVVRGFQRGFPFGTRLCLQSVVCYTCWRGCQGKRGAVLLAPRLLRQENRRDFCEWE